MQLQFTLVSLPNSAITQKTQSYLLGQFVMLLLPLIHSLLVGLLLLLPCSLANGQLT